MEEEEEKEEEEKEETSHSAPWIFPFDFLSK